MRRLSDLPGFSERNVQVKSRDFKRPESDDGTVHRRYHPRLIFLPPLTALMQRAIAHSVCTRRWTDHRVGSLLLTRPVRAEPAPSIALVRQFPPRPVPAAWPLTGPVVLCVDEKSQIQALDRSQPVLPMMPGRCARRQPGPPTRKRRTGAFSGGLWYRPTTSTTFSMNSRSDDSLNPQVRWGTAAICCRWRLAATNGGASSLSITWGPG